MLLGRSLYLSCSRTDSKCFLPFAEFSKALVVTTSHDSLISVNRYLIANGHFSIRWIHHTRRDGFYRRINTGRIFRNMGKPRTDEVPLTNSAHPKRAQPNYYSHDGLQVEIAEQSQDLSNETLPENQIPG